VVCGLFQLYLENYNCIPRLQLLDMDKSVKSLKLLGRCIDSFFSLGRKLQQVKRLQTKKKRVGFTSSFAVRFYLVNLEGGGCLLVIGPVTSHTGGLIVSVTEQN